MDLVSRPEAYAHLHRKIIDSYSVEAMFDEGAGGFEPAVAAMFLDGLRALSGQEYPTPGTGRAVRYVGDDVLGSALVVRGTPVHIAFFSSDPAAVAGGGRMSGWSERRDRLGGPFAY